LLGEASGGGGRSAVAPPRKPLDAHRAPVPVFAGPPARAPDRKGQADPSLRSARASGQEHGEGCVQGHGGQGADHHPAVGIHRARRAPFRSFTGTTSLRPERTSENDITFTSTRPISSAHLLTSSSRSSFFPFGQTTQIMPSSFRLRL